MARACQSLLLLIRKRKTCKVKIMTLPTFENVTLHEYRDGRLAEVTLPFSAEYAVALSINSTPYITMASSGTYLREHITGYLLTEGIITDIRQLVRLEVDEAALAVNAVLLDDPMIADRLERIKTLSAAGGRGKKIPPPAHLVRGELPCLRAEIVLQAMNEFLTYSREHETTHGVHGAALYSLAGERLAFFDEIGRHNAIDKVIGHAAQNNIALADKLICSTGRISSEIANKIIFARAPILVTRASPTTLSVQLLRRFNILSIIRAVNGRFYVVNGSDRIL